MKNGEKLKISSKRFYSIKRKEIGAIKYSITSLQDDTNIKILNIRVVGYRFVIESI